MVVQLGYFVETILNSMWQHPQWYIGGLIVFIGLFVVGAKDVARLSCKRIWAISSVCFAESIRRRILWLTPVAILGVVIVSQLQRPFDEQDAIRQTVKFCLFATGLLVTMATIILACTSLPKEIENRVIYTVVTKPTTRLEIVLGKVVGFGRISAAILIIMGLFTWGYLQLRAWNLQQDIQARLDHGAVDAASVPTLKHYVEMGLLSAKTYAQPTGLQFYSRLPEIGSDQRWINGNGEQSFVVAFDVKPEDFQSPAAREMGFAILANMDYEQRELTEEEKQQNVESDPTVEPSGDTAMGPTLLSAKANKKVAKSRALPTMNVQILSRTLDTLVLPENINGGKPVTLLPKGSGRPVEIPINPVVIDPVTRSGRIYVVVMGLSVGTEYGMAKEPLALVIPGATANSPVIVRAARDEKGQPMAPIFQARRGMHGQQIRGDEAGKGTVAVYQFHDTKFLETSEGKIPFELRAGVERSGADEDDLTNLQVQIRNLKTGAISEPVVSHPEASRTVFFDVPASAAADGNFDVIVKCMSKGHWVGLRAGAPGTTGTLGLISGNDDFSYNLAKSLAIIWLLTLLVVIISIFCSTFVSWPIAVVLTMVILLGRWGVDQVGDIGSQGLGRQVVNDLFKGASPPVAETLNRSIEALTGLLNVTSKVLPDLSQFSAVEDIEQGVSIPVIRLLQALQVIAMFGIPIMVLSYVFLKNKEVAQ